MCEQCKEDSGFVKAFEKWFSSLPKEKQKKMAEKARKSLVKNFDASLFFKQGRRCLEELK